MSSKRKRAEAIQQEEPEEEEIVFHQPESYSDSDEDDEASDAVVEKKSGNYGNRQRILILSSRGITARYRHLLEDLKKLMPHHKKDSKLDCKGDMQVVNEIAEMKSCNQILYLDTRKHMDLYMYLGHAPHGPTAKFQVVNVHTMDELKLTGNCMLGSRPVLNFDIKFETSPHWKLLKGILSDAFNTPKGHPKSKPFFDHIISFFIVKNNICKYLFSVDSIVYPLLSFLDIAGIRNYQIVEKSDKKADSGESTSLVEIGPRFVLIPIRIFSGSLGGATLYQNPAYVSPNEERSLLKRKKGYALMLFLFICMDLYDSE